VEETRMNRLKYTTLDKAIRCNTAEDHRSELTDLLTGVVDAAYAVAHFAKFNEYPKECSSEFVEFTEKINRLEIELKKAGYPLTR
jgi:hypothetical protein